MRFFFYTIGYVPMTYSLFTNSTMNVKNIYDQVNFVDFFIESGCDLICIIKGSKIVWEAFYLDLFS